MTGLGLKVFIDPSELPEWLRPLVSKLSAAGDLDLSYYQPPPGTETRKGSVLIAFGEGDAGPDVLLLERAADLRSHAGQPAFPGGAVDADDADPVATALREAQEETRLDPAEVTVVARLPELWLPPSGFSVTPVIAWLPTDSATGVGDPIEVAAVHRIPIGDLVNPTNRVLVKHPTGYIGHGFQIDGMLIWGFTGMLLSELLAMGNFDREWLPGRVVPFDDGWRMPAEMDQTWLPGDEDAVG